MPQQETPNTRTPRSLDLNDRKTEAKLRHLLASQDPQPLGAAMPGQPGVYVLLLNNKAANHPVYGDAVEDHVNQGGLCVYVGSARNLRVRLTQHRRQLDAISFLQPDVVSVRTVQTSLAVTTYAESILLGALRPLWCNPELSGFGSKHVGRARIGQQRSAWATLHGKHGGALTANSATREELLEQLHVLLRDRKPAPGGM